MPGQAFDSEQSNYVLIASARVKTMVAVLAFMNDCIVASLTDCVIVIAVETRPLQDKRPPHEGKINYRFGDGSRGLLASVNLADKL